ncbi:unnamed protein product [Timema podura]|uniref:Uncharacterized protein n=1 Tax=Timema podura TaxID=61482 RepID=A0ABN7PGE5_TIMPD|nr:unnamed protein product [Timema podura]
MDDLCYQLRGLDVPATPGQPFSFTMDTSTTGGLGDVVLDVVHSGHSVSHHKELLGGELYKVTFTPHTSGKYRIYVYFNGTDVRASLETSAVVKTSVCSQDRSEIFSPHSYKLSHLLTLLLSDLLEVQRSAQTIDCPIADHYHRLCQVLDVPSSPFSVRVGSSGQRSREKSNSPITRNLTSQQYVSSASYSSPEDSRWSRRQTGSPHHLVTESRSSMERLQLSDERGGSPARMVNGRGPSPLYPRERVSPVTKKISESRSPSQSPTAFKQSVNVRRGSVDLLEDRNIVDTSSNVRVSSMLGSSNLRSDSWDAISKTKSLLSFGSLESLANLTNRNQTSRDETTQQSDPHLPAVVSGEALKMLSINRPASVSVELTEPANLGDVTVTVTAPSRRNVPVKLFRNRDKVTASFTACEIGEHVIDVRAGDHRVNGAPFRTQAYNAAAIHVGRIPPAVLGQPVEFESKL